MQQPWECLREKSYVRERPGIRWKDQIEEALSSIDITNKNRRARSRGAWKDVLRLAEIHRSSCYGTLSELLYLALRQVYLHDAHKLIKKKLMKIYTKYINAKLQISLDSAYNQNEQRHSWPSLNRLYNNWTCVVLIANSSNATINISNFHAHLISIFT